MLERRVYCARAELSLVDETLPGVDDSRQLLSERGWCLEVVGLYNERLDKQEDMDKVGFASLSLKAPACPIDELNHSSLQCATCKQWPGASAEEAVAQPVGIVIV